MYSEPTTAAEVRQRAAMIHKKFWAAPAYVAPAVVVALPEPVEVKRKRLASLEAAILTLQPYEERRFAADEIRAAVLAVTKVAKEDFVGPRRFRNIAEARQQFYWLCRKYTKLSLPKIGVFAGGLDHTTVMHGIKKIDANMDKYQSNISAILEILEASHA